MKLRTFLSKVVNIKDLGASPFLGETANCPLTAAAEAWDRETLANPDSPSPKVGDRFLNVALISSTYHLEQRAVEAFLSGWLSGLMSGAGTKVEIFENALEYAENFELEPFVVD